MSKKSCLIFVLIIIAAGGVYFNRIYSRFYGFLNNPAGLEKTLDFSRNYTVNPTGNSNSLRYAALGDSLTAGVGADSVEGTFPYQLAKKITGSEKIKIELLNLGVPGARSAQVISGQLTELEKFQPDLITLFIGTNDMHNWVSLAEFKENFQTILSRLSPLKCRVMVINLPYLGADNLAWPPLKLFFNEKIKKYNQIIVQEVEKAKLNSTAKFGLLDLHRGSAELFASSSEPVYSVDRYHPSAVGYKLWSEFIYANYH